MSKNKSGRSSSILGLISSFLHALSTSKDSKDAPSGADAVMIAAANHFSSVHKVNLG